MPSQQFGIACRSGWSVAALCLCLSACDRATPGSSAPIRSSRNLLLVTIDGARADRLGCYGNADAKTPGFDALARAGALFERAYTQVPITLPAHAVLLTGRYPRETGLRENARAALAETHDTLATLAKRADLKTAAFISNLALARRFGLARGFDIYDDRIPRETTEAESVAYTRSATEMTDRALAWLKSNAAGGDRFLCWVHYSDPRPPHEPPPDFRVDAKIPYDGELAYVDAEVQRLTKWLDEAKLAEDTLIMVVGAHGEALGDDAPAGHALLLQEGNIRVPWLVVFPGTVPPGRRITGPVELAQLLPTVCGLMSWSSPSSVPGASLADALLGSSDVPAVACYAESTYGFANHRWAEQRALIEGNWKYISSTRPELYDLSSDSAGARDVHAANASVAADLDRKLRARYAAMPPGQSASPTTQPTSGPAAQVLALEPPGDEFLTAGAPDPKDGLELLDRAQRIPRLLRDSKLDEAITLLESIAAASPGSPEFQRALGTACGEAGRIDAALTAMTRAVELDPRGARTQSGLGDALVLKGDFAKAADHYSIAVALDPTDAELHFMLARTRIELNDYDAASLEYQEALILVPRYIDAAMELITLVEQFDRAKDILPFFESLARDNPEDPGAIFNLGVIFAALTRYEDAIPRFKAALALDPEFGHAYNKLGICAARLERPDEALAYFDRAKHYAPSRAEGWYNTGVALGRLGKGTEAAEAYEQAIINQPNYPSAIDALTRIYGAAKDVKNVVRILRGAVVARPTDVRMHATLADVLSTTQDASLRNGEEALRHARRAIELAGARERPGLLSTLGTALAETGDFAGAKAAATRARALADSEGNRKLADLIAKQLAGYERGEAYRGTKY